MKKWLIGLFLLHGYLGFAQVKFVQGDWNQLLDQAKKEKKLLFLDAYTDWCTWCKVLDKETFSDSTVGAFMNQQFVSTKLEMEKSEMGKKISLKYGIGSFPTALVYTGEGKLVYIITGYSPPVDYLKELKLAANPQNHWNLKGYSNTYDLAYPDFFMEAMAENGKRKFPKKEVVNDYLRNQKDPYVETCWVVWKRFAYSLDQERKDFFLQHYLKFEDYYGKPPVEDIIKKFIQVYVDSAAKTKDEQLFKKSLGMLNQYIEKGKKEEPWYELYYFEKSANWKMYGKSADKLIKNEPEITYSNINEFAWKIYEECEDQDVLLLAISWMKPVVEKAPLYMYLDTYAALLYKTHQLKEAEKYALLAIEKGKAEKEKIEATEELLLKIRKK